MGIWRAANVSHHPSPSRRYRVSPVIWCAASRTRARFPFMKMASSVDAGFSPLCVARTLLLTLVSMIHSLMLTRYAFSVSLPTHGLTLCGICGASGRCPLAEDAAALAFCNSSRSSSGRDNARDAMAAVWFCALSLVHGWLCCGQTQAILCWHAAFSMSVAVRRTSMACGTPGRKGRSDRDSKSPCERGRRTVWWCIMVCDVGDQRCVSVLERVGV